MDSVQPRLRIVDFIPVEHEGQQVVVIRDPDRLFDDQLAVPLTTFVLMTLFNGERDVRGVQEEIMRQTGQLIPIEQLAGLAEELDRHYLLDNERTRLRREALEQEFADLAARPAAHAGAAYPADPDELISVFDGYFAGAQGPADRPVPAKTPRGLVTPHIDIREGGPCMAHAFQRLQCPDPPGLYIILGVAHQPTPNLYTMTDKDFETPLGPARVHRAAAERLAELYGAERLSGQYAHKFEHSVEFQTAFLTYLHRGDHPFTILPLLCGSYEGSMNGNGAAPRERPEIGEFCDAIRALIEELDERVCIIAGVDLSHVGKKFHEDRGVDDHRAEMVRAADLGMLEQVRNRDPEAFFDHFRPDSNARNVDAVAAVYTMLHVLGPGEAELLAYDQYRERETDSMVTYASMALY